MSTQSDAETALDGLRVLDLADEKGLYCTKLLADLGADMIKVEKPGGDATRNIGPFWHNTPHPEKSLYFAYLNSNKRGITLNLESAEGRDIFKKLVKGADIIVETYAPGYLAGIGLGYPALRELNPGLIMTSITGFGQSGPYRDFRSSEIISLAMGGLMFQTGDPDTPPLQAGGFQIYSMTGMYAALATLQALYYRNLTGEGQQVDASMQECVHSLLEMTCEWYFFDGEMQRRAGSGIALMGMPDLLHPCQDGYVLLIAIQPAMWESLAKWMISEGIEVGEFADPVWGNQEKQATRSEEINSIINELTRKYTKAELFREGQKKGLAITPLLDFKEIVEDPHLNARSYFVKVDHPEMGSFKFPGAPYKLGETPWAIRRSSPLIGQHNEEIYRELGFSKEDLGILRGSGVI